MIVSLTTKTYFAILTLISFSTVALAQNSDVAKAVTAQHGKKSKFRGKPLFKYPGDKPKSSVVVVPRRESKDF